MQRLKSADWVDQEAVRDGNLVTGRKPDDIPGEDKGSRGIGSLGTTEYGDATQSVRIDRA